METLDLGPSTLKLPLTPEQKRLELQAAKRWCRRQESAKGALEKERCHDQVMAHLYRVLGHVPTNPVPGKLL
jgi:hypothetical protein